MQRINYCKDQLLIESPEPLLNTKISTGYIERDLRSQRFKITVRWLNFTAMKLHENASVKKTGRHCWPRTISWDNK